LAQPRPTLPPPPDPVLPALDDKDDAEVEAGLALLLLCVVDAGGESALLADGLGEGLGLGWAVGLALLDDDDDDLCLQRFELLEAARFRFAMAP